MTASVMLLASCIKEAEWDDFSGQMEMVSRDLYGTFAMWQRLEASEEFSFSPFFR